MPDPVGVGHDVLSVNGAASAGRKVSTRAEKKARRRMRDSPEPEGNAQHNRCRSHFGTPCVISHARDPLTNPEQVSEDRCQKGSNCRVNLAPRPASQDAVIESGVAVLARIVAWAGGETRISWCPSEARCSPRSSLSCPLRLPLAPSTIPQATRRCVAAIVDATGKLDARGTRDQAEAGGWLGDMHRRRRAFLALPAPLRHRPANSNGVM